MNAIWTDLRSAARSLRRSPGFTLAAVAILALGIGANTAIFSLIDAVLLRPLPGVASPGELVDIRGHVLSYPVLKALREGARGRVRVSAWSRRELSLSGASSPQRITGLVVTGDYFDVLGAAPSAGRLLFPSDEDSGASVAVLSHDLWTTRFGGDPAVVGSTVRLNGTPFTVVGVAPPGLRGTVFGVFTDVWVTIGAWPHLATGNLARLDLSSRNWGWLVGFGRRAPGVGIPAARTAVVEALRRDAAANGEEFRAEDWSARPTASAADLGDGIPARVFAILAAAVVCALMIACANLANLLIARASRREREIALRQALGASRGRLIRMLLSESFLLCLAGGAAGTMVAVWALGLSAAVPLPDEVSIGAFGASLDSRALAFSAALSAATGLIFGLLPALRASRTRLLPSIQASSPTVTRRSSLRWTLVAAQIALCLGLLASAGLLGRSLGRALSVDLGFDPQGVTLASVNLGLERYSPERAAAFLERVPARLAESRGVKAASIAATLPLSGGVDNDSFEAEGYTPPPGVHPDVDNAAVGAGYFATLRIPLLEGRVFTVRDRQDAPPVAIVNAAMARRYFPGRSAVGRWLKIAGTARTIVGVVGNVRSQGIGDAPGPQAYLPISQLTDSAALSKMEILVRSEDGRSAPALIREEVRLADPGLPVTNVEPYAAIVDAQLLPQRVGSSLLGVFGALSLVLAAFGIYAVVSWSSSRRRREFGIRLALGARPADVRRLVLRETALPLVVGVGAGLGLAVAAGRLLRGLLYGVAPADPATLAAVCAVLAASALVAADLPARRAAHTDPVDALRSE